MPSADATELARLSSALDRATIRAKVAVQRGDWALAREAAAAAEEAKAALEAARRPALATNVVGRRRVNG